MGRIKSESSGLGDGREEAFPRHERRGARCDNFLFATGSGDVGKTRPLKHLKERKQKQQEGETSGKEQMLEFFIRHGEREVRKTPRLKQQQERKPK